MNPKHYIKLNCKIPKSYRKTFYLGVQESQHKLEIKGNRAYYFEKGKSTKHESSLVLDWIQESIAIVRSEFES